MSSPSSLLPREGMLDKSLRFVTTKQIEIILSQVSLTDHADERKFYQIEFEHTRELILISTKLIFTNENGRTWTF